MQRHIHMVKYIVQLFSYSIQMNRREILLLWEVARTGSVTRASERVRMSQPAASATIRSIEERVGFALFTREKRRLEFTPKGRALLPEISNALAALSSLDRLTEELRVDAASRVTIACVAAAATTMLPFALRVLLERMPNARLVVRSGMSLEIVNMVAEQRIDFGIVVGDTAAPEGGAADICTLGLHAVMRPDSPLIAHDRISLPLLCSHPYISLARHLHLGTLAARRFEEAGLVFNPVVEVTHFSSACAFAEAGYGTAILDSSSLPYSSRIGLIARPIDVPDQIPFRLLWPKGTALAKYAPLLRDALAQAAAAAPRPAEGAGDPSANPGLSLDR